MIIEKFILPADEATKVGLKRIEMSRLGRFVAIAGKNGAGKTRLLAQLEDFSNKRRTNLPNLSAWRIGLTNTQQHLAQNPRSPHASDWEQQNATYKKAIDETLGRVVANENVVFRPLRFVPKTLELADPKRHTQEANLSKFSEAKSIAIDRFALVCLSYIQQIQNRYWEATHPGFTGTAKAHEEAKSDYVRLNELIYAFLGVKLKRTVNGEAEIFSKPIAEAGLSDGQKVILQLVTAIHAQRSTLDNTVFILDELENHLHPSVAVDLLENLTRAAPNAQIWIATHSIPLLAYIQSIEPMALWYMEDGEIAHAGRHPERVLRALLGDETRIGQLHALTGLPSQLASSTFAAESLFPPTVQAEGEGDPQASQVAKILAKASVDKPLSILDFGSGKGRLLEGLGVIQKNAKLSERINYFAFDESDKDKALCLSIIREYFDNPDTRYFNSPDKFYAAKDDSSIDVVVMCNVFHEINPNKWFHLFSPEALIMRALKPGGFLLIVEDQRIPIGEKAHENGFFVLDTPHLKTLFGVNEADKQSGSFFCHDYRDDGRLKAHLIEKRLLGNICYETKKKAILELLETAKNQVRECRGQAANYVNGLTHGFWTQQLANAYLHLDELG